MAAIDPMFRLLVLRSLKRRRQRGLIVFLALMVGAAIVTAMAAVYFDIHTKMSRELRSFGANFYLGPQEADGRLSLEQYRRVLGDAPADLVLAASPYLYGMVRLEQEPVVVMGVDFDSVRRLVPYWQVEGQWIGVGFDQRNAMIGRKLAERLQLAIGERLQVVTDSGRRALRIKGIVEAGDNVDNYLIVNIGLAQQLLGKPQQLQHALFSLMNVDNQVTAFAERIDRRYPELTAQPIRRVSAAEGQVLEKIKGMMALVAAIILALTTLCINTTLLAMINERRREFALQMSLGADRGGIIRQLLCEVGLIALAAVAGGLLLGYGLAQLLGQTVFSASIGMRLPVLPITLVLSLLATQLACIMPLKQIARIEPARVLKGE